MESSTVNSKKVLVLNKLWTAIDTCSLADAIVLLFGEFKYKLEDGSIATEPKAKIVDPYTNFNTYTWEDWSKLKPKKNEETIRTYREEFRIPEVILLSRYDRVPVAKMHFNRRSLFKRDDYKCQYCGCSPGSGELTIDHIVPKSRNGKTTWTNCVLSCVKCNSKKANRTPEEANMKLLKVPKKPKFNISCLEKTIPQSWEHFLSEVYWNTELDNDE